MCTSHSLLHIEPERQRTRTARRERGGIHRYEGSDFARTAGALGPRRNVMRWAGSLNVAATDLDGGCMDQFQAWVGNEPAGPTREPWDEAAQDAVSAGLAAWVTDCIATAIDWSTAPAFISRTRRAGSTNNQDWPR